MKMKSRFRYVMVMFIFLLSGCAGYSITYNGTGDGYDVYRPEPYLLVTPGEKSLAAQIVWLPNYKERYRIKTWNFLGKADFQFQITDGWRLTGISDKSDNTDMASGLLDILKQSVKAGTISLTDQPMLFRIKYNEKGEFYGLTFLSVVK